MFWGCIGYNGVGSLEVIDGTMDSVSYTRVLSTFLHDSADILGVSDNFIIQQDNAPCHKSNYTRSFFTENEINVMEWPALSPDLNPSENVWAYIDQRLEKKVHKSKSQSIADVQQIGKIFRQATFESYIRASQGGASWLFETKADIYLIELKCFHFLDSCPAIKLLLSLF
ncbi:hypothetical protein ENBRE01_2673 [Enteropsectra breve]|nr:hypothetical protein ENBRE01_2673 [Enteropsectra breve]